LNLTYRNLPNEIAHFKGKSISSAIVRCERWKRKVNKSNYGTNPEGGRFIKKLDFPANFLQKGVN